MSTPLVAAKSAVERHVASVLPNGIASSTIIFTRPMAKQGLGDHTTASTIYFKLHDPEEAQQLSASRIAAWIADPADPLPRYNADTSQAFIADRVEAVTTFLIELQHKIDGKVEH